MGVACCPDAAFCVTNDGTNAAAVWLQVYEFRFDAPSCVCFVVAKVQEALIDFDVILGFDVGGFEFVHGLGFRGKGKGREKEKV